MRRRSRIRCLVGILACVAFGLTATLAVVAARVASDAIRMSRAKGPVYLASTRHTLAGTETGTTPAVVSVTRSLAKTSWIVEHELGIVPVGLPPGVTFQGPVAPRSSVTPPAWVPLPPEEVGRGTAAIGFGWPCVCLKITSERISARATRPGPGGSPVIQTRMMFAGERRVRISPTVVASVPLLPVWPGLLMNVAFFGALAGLIFLVRPVRAALRRRAGRCPACSYQLAGLGTCPECGGGATSPAFR
jgi:hypothetical protein